ncbi:Hsp20/alpha crystallin family protein [Stakelama marina]|uniref:Hsp20/alpha crystallin family protein n=1 Tax=Stakelama marina TaxID=2826939 RepID=UPI0024C380A8|nr:Hsp20/alpha crystallin family protein [Stakelama marina]
MRTDSPFGWIRSEIDRIFEDFGRPARDLLPIGNGFGPEPAIEMVERDKDYRLTAELPGMSEDDVDVSVVNDSLCISGEKREEKESNDQGFMFRERRYGGFERRIPLPADVDPDAISAGFKKGVLTVTLAKDQQAEPRSRKIKVEAH